MKLSDKPAKKISAKRLAANQQNALKSTGPHDTRSTRFNAVKHGLLSEGVTEMDDPTAFLQYRARLEAELKPLGELEIGLVRRIALLFVRLRRAAVLEAEFITEKLNPTMTEKYHHDEKIDLLMLRYAATTVVLDPGLPARLSVADVEALQVFQRYETSLETKFFRALHQLERIQRIRCGENVAPPVMLNVDVSEGPGGFVSQSE